MIKRRVTLSDSAQIFWLNQQINGSSRLKRWLLYREMIGILKGKLAWPWEVSAKNLLSLLTEAGFLKGVKTDDGFKKINEIAAWIGSYLGKTIEEVLSSTTNDEVSYIYNAILSRQINDSVMSAMAQHDTKGLTKELDKIKNQIQSNRSRMEIDEAPKNPVSTTTDWLPVASILSQVATNDL